MTDPNKAALTESNAQFVARMKRTGPENRLDVPRLIALAEERVMIEDKRLDIQFFERQVSARNYHLDLWADEGDLSTALRSVAAKIGEGK